MPINPVQFAHSVCDEFLRYLFSAFPLSDPELAQQAKKLLERPSSLDIPLVKGPFVSLSESFAKGELVQKMASDGILHSVMPGLIGYPTMYLHQQQVLEAVKQGNHVLVATGTGSGKTESFLYPIIDDLLRQRDQGIISGLTAILVYPMNALANDQLDRLRDMLGGTGITFGQWVGTTPKNDSEKDKLVERFAGSSRQAYLETRRKRREEAQAEDRAVRPLAPHEECCTEEDIQTRLPRILLTNYRQLEVLTTRLPDVQMFANAPLKYLVFDEAHTYAGATGAEVACLVRRLRALAGKSSDEIVCIGTSATLSDPTKKDKDNDETARRFASRFFGVDPNKVKLIGESYVAREWPPKRYRPIAPHGDGMERLGRILDAVTEPVQITTIKSVVEDVTGQIFDPGDDWQDSLFDHLVTNEYVYQTTQILKQPKWLKDAAWQTSQTLAPNRLPEGDRANAELLSYLVLGAAARKNGDSLLRPKVHFFLRGLDEMVVALDGTDSAPKMKLFLSLAEAKEEYGSRHDDSFFPVLTCKNCGQHFFEKWYANLEPSDRKHDGFDSGNATTNDDGSDNAYWSTSPANMGGRLLMTNRLLEEADGGRSTKSGKWPKAYFCRQCGAMHRNFSSRCLADGCGHKEPLLPMIAFGPGISACPSCSSLSFQIGGRTIEPARKIQAVTVADVHILAQGMINSAPEGHKKLIIFADSRQDAAFQAGWMQDHARRIRLRHMMYSIIADNNSPLALDEITVRLVDLFRKDQNLIESLLPELTGEEAATVFNFTPQTRLVVVRKALRYMVLREFTTGVRRTDCLESMGLARVAYHGVNTQSKLLRQFAETVGISPEQAVEGICLILDNWRRNRILDVTDDPIYSRYHKKDDEFIQAGLLPLKEFHPKGLILDPDDSNKCAQSLIARRGASAVQALLKKWAVNPAKFNVNATVGILWEFLTEEARVLKKTEIRSQNDRVLAHVWQVNLDKLAVESHQGLERCSTCQRITTRSAPYHFCTRHNCHGKTKTEQPDQENYDVWLMGRPFLMVSAEEHTAQVPGEVRNKIENDFKSRNGRTNCLVATPTLEMGVNIGALDMALMRNVPPRPSNYWQRAGRAGREERMAVVVTYCRRSPHDRYFFDDPLKLLGGAIEAPTFNLRNPLMVAKHIRSAILSELLLRSRKAGEEGESGRELLKQLFPPFIRNYLLDEDDHFRDVPTSTSRLAELLAEVKESLADRLVMLFAKHWPKEAAELVNRAAIEQTIAETAQELDVVIKRLHRRFKWSLDTLARLHREKETRELEKEEEQLYWRVDNYRKNILRYDHTTYTLTVLAGEGFLPGYGVYDGGIKASAQRSFARTAGPRSFDLARSNVVALREFVPGNRLYANRGTFYVSRYHLGADEAARIRNLYVNVAKGYVTEQPQDGQSGSVPIDALPMADLDLAHESRITEDENLRFSMPVSVMGRLRKRNRGGKAFKIGDREVSHVRGQGIELVNLGEAGRVKRGDIGHLICSVCGAAKTPYAVQKETDQFKKIHKERCGKNVVCMALAAQAEVDMLQFHGVADEAQGINIGEALRTAASRLLDMGQEDLQLLIVHKPDDKLDLLIYDPMPGGSGLLEQMLARWLELIATAKDLLAGCSQACETACYACLKTFRNQFYHPLLNRHKALELMNGLQFIPEGYGDIVPMVEEDQSGEGTPSNEPEARLIRILGDHHFPLGECRKRITTSLGIPTEPDWLHEPTKVAIYLDGMSRSLHGDPKTAKRDQIIRQALEMDDYKVIVVQKRDLDDLEAVRLHLRNIAQAMGRGDLA